MSRAQYLYRLQTIDSQIDEAQQYLKKIEANLGKSKVVLEAEQAMESMQTALRQARTKMQDLDLEVKSLATKISQQEKKLYSGKVSNAKEAANLQDEVASLKRWHTQREEALLETMLKVEEVEEQANQTQTDLRQVTDAWTEEQEKLHQLQIQFQDKMGHLMAQRPSVTQHIKEADLVEYNRLRRKHGGRAVAGVKGNLCQGCNVAIPNNTLRRARNEDKLVYCDTCGKILYVS